MLQVGPQSELPGPYAASLSLTALSKALKTAGGGKATVHGTARLTFKDWASERT